MSGTFWSGKPEVISGSLSYLDAGGEQTVFEITAVTKHFVTGIMVDMTTITQNGTFKLYSKIDGTNYRELAALIFTVATDSDGVLFDYRVSVDTDFKLTYTEGADEGAVRALPYKYTLEG